MPIHVDGREEDGLHLVVPQFVGRQVGGNQHLVAKEGWVNRFPPPPPPGKSGRISQDDRPPLA